MPARLQSYITFWRYKKQRIARAKLLLSVSLVLLPVTLVIVLVSAARWRDRAALFSPRRFVCA